MCRDNVSGQCVGTMYRDNVRDDDSNNIEDDSSNNVRDRVRDIVSRQCTETMFGTMLETMAERGVNIKCSHIFIRIDRELKAIN